MTRAELTQKYAIHLGYWNHATDEQLGFVAGFCKDRELLDLGGHNGTLSLYLLDAGARQARVIDKEVPFAKADHPALTFDACYFSEFNEAHSEEFFDVGLVSWPINYSSVMADLVSILQRCRSVIYFGKNDGGTQCGTLRLWEYLITRNLEMYLPSPRNTVIIYGSVPRPTTQRQTEEEISGLEAGFLGRQRLMVNMEEPLGSILERSVAA